MVTGANAGIGRACAGQLAARGATVVMLCRSRERGEEARQAIARDTGGDVRLVLADLGSQQSVRAAAAELAREHARIDVLVNNAAAFNLSQRAPSVGGDGVETIWSTNHLGPFLLTLLLLDRLVAAGGRVVNVSSLGLVVMPWLRLDLDDPDSRGSFSVTRAYYRSKIAQCAFTVELARRYPALQANVVRVANVALPDDRLPPLNPVTRWFYRNVKRRFALTPDRMADTYVWLALDAPPAIHGLHIDERRRSIGYPRQVADEAFRSALWSLSERQTALT